MAYFRRLLVAAIGASSLVGATAVGVGAHDGGTLIEFDSMGGVSAAVAAAQIPNDRGIKPGGAPWVISSGSGEVDRQGHVSVRVTGLIIPNPPLGFNPVGSFTAVVSCLTPDGVMNTPTQPVATNRAGNATFNTTVALPHPCKSPEVFVGLTRGTGEFVWFAQSNSEDEQD
jgi:hypothetical protein